MVDYSKWDKMDFSDSSDDEEEGSKVPRVTALDQGSKVTFGGEGNIDIKSSTSTSQPRQSLSSTTSADIPVVSSSVSGDTIDISTMNDINNNSNKMQQDTKKIKQLQTQLTLNGGEHYCIVNNPISISSLRAFPRYGVGGLDWMGPSVPFVLAGRGSMN